MKQDYIGQEASLNINFPRDLETMDALNAFLVCCGTFRLKLNLSESSNLNWFLVGRVKDVENLKNYIANQQLI